VNALRARCCIAGGGPAGMMLGYLLARADGALYDAKHAGRDRVVIKE